MDKFKELKNKWEQKSQLNKMLISEGKYKKRMSLRKSKSTPHDTIEKNEEDDEPKIASTPNMNEIKKARRISLWRERDLISEEISTKWNQKAKGSVLIQKSPRSQDLITIEEKFLCDENCEDCFLPTTNKSIEFCENMYYEFYNINCFPHEPNTSKFIKIEYLEKYKYYYQKIFHKKNHLLIFGSLAEEKYPFSDPFIVAIAQTKYENSDIYPVQLFFFFSFFFFIIYFIIFFFIFFFFRLLCSTNMGLANTKFHCLI